MSEDAAGTAVLAVQGLRKSFRTGQHGVAAVDDVSFETWPGELYTLLGPSGCGKTTTLRCIAGLERPDAGRIRIGAKMVTDAGARTFLAPYRRSIGMVFQSYAIWPHMTVFDNVAFPLRVTGVRHAEVRRRVTDVLEVVGLAGLEERLAPQLSGGQQQRTALARALVGRPRLLLLDEPLSNLDARLREAMRNELRSLQRQLGVTAVYVTHDQVEALSLSTRIAVMDRGRIVQEGTPTEVYERPATRYVAGFVGASNFIEGELVTRKNGRARVRTRLGELVVTNHATQPTGASVSIAIRPEQVVLRPHDGTRPSAVENVVVGVVSEAQYLGEAIEYVIEVNGFRVKCRRPAAPAVATGESVHIELPPGACSLVGAR
ncbi:MAG TPA: ABC transporter ATP-binding protein [Candidatus Dormibacteraeota bacterium]|nr:ABC transporter ATP-binding protein [Candidatus Dormibacteraeota bacterium]